MDHCIWNVRNSTILITLLSFSFLTAQDAATRTLAVMDFDSFGVSVSEVQALTNRLRSNIVKLNAYRVIERGLMQSILTEQNFQMSGCTSDECAVEIGQLLGAELMLSGSIGKVGSTWSIEMRIVDVESGQIIRSASYDTQGAVDLVLTEGMGAAARRIAGVQLQNTGATEIRIE